MAVAPKASDAAALPKTVASYSQTESMMLSPFHLAIPVHDIEAARGFYGGLFGCAEGRSDTEWVDFDFFGHQLVAHRDPSKQAFSKASHTNKVDGKDVPVPHFGVVLAWDQWHTLSMRLSQAGVEFAIET